MEPEPETDECPTFVACRRFADSLGLPEGTFDPTHNCCYCHRHCAAGHPNKSFRGSNVYGLPKGWCGLGLKVDAADFDRRRIFQEWHVAFHGTTVETITTILKTEWQLMLPGDVTPSGFRIPIRDGHIHKSFKRVNKITGEEEDFDPNQVHITHPALHVQALLLTSDAVVAADFHVPQH